MELTDELGTVVNVDALTPIAYVETDRAYFHIMRDDAGNQWLYNRDDEEIFSIGFYEETVNL